MQRRTQGLPALRLRERRKRRFWLALAQQREPARERVGAGGGRRKAGCGHGAGPARGTRGVGLNHGQQAGIQAIMLALALPSMPDTVTTAPRCAESQQPLDQELIRRAAAGEPAAFEQLYRLHVRRVFGVVWRLVGGNEARAEELTQEAFVRAWQALPQFRFESAFSTWLHRLAVNTALMHLRARAGGEDRETDDAALEFHAASGSRDGLRLDLERAVARLPPRARAVLVLHDVEGWKHHEIASELGMAVGSSKAQLHRARGLLRGWLGGEAT